MGIYGYIIGAIAVIIVLFLILCMAVVPAGHVGIQNTLGIVSNDLLQPGFYFKSPLTSVVSMSTQIEKYSVSATAASYDLQEAQTDVVVNYRINPDKAIEIYKSIGREFENKIIIPAVAETTKSNTAKYTATNLIQTRALVKADVDKALSDRLTKYGFEVVDVSMTEYKFSPEFTKAIEAKQVAEQQIGTAQNTLKIKELEAQQIAVTAKGQADAIKINADAQAYQLDQISNKLTQNPLLVQYKAIEKWDGILPKVTGTNTPLINIE